MNTQETAVVKHEERRDILEIAPHDVKRKLEAIGQFQALVRNQLKKEHDFGVIPGTEKPTLLKPGAEKIAKLLNLQDDYDVLEKVEDWGKPFFFYTVKCRLTEISSGILISSGLGSCNSMESRYRYRWIPEWKLTEAQKSVKDNFPFEERSYRQKQGKFKSYRFENDDIFSQVNTILKMAKKRALVDATLSAGRLSDLFTQDLEDIVLPAKDDEEAVSENGAGDSSPEPKESKGHITLTIYDGRKMPLDRAGALRYFIAAAKAIGEKEYGKTLGEHGYEKADEIPDEQMPVVFDALVTIWKANREKGKKK